MPSHLVNDEEAAKIAKWLSQKNNRKTLPVIGARFFSIWE